jgi:probable rRNA maturation factor
MPFSILHPPSSLVLSVANRQRTKKINSRLLKEIAAALFAELKIAEAELGIALVGTREMARVNWQFLQHQGSTDVITFDHRDEALRITHRASRIHGELFVCVDDAVAQAKTFKTNWQSEVVRYVIHGVLHLLNHDDLQPAARRKMKRAENRLLRRLAKRFSLAQLSRAAKIKA